MFPKVAILMHFYCYISCRGLQNNPAFSFIPVRQENSDRWHITIKMRNHISGTIVPGVSLTCHSHFLVLPHHPMIGAGAS